MRTFSHFPHEKFDTRPLNNIYFNIVNINDFFGGNARAGKAHADYGTLKKKV